MTAATTRSRRRASLAAAVAAGAVFVIAVVLLLVNGTSGDSAPQRTRSVSTDVTSSAGKRTVTVRSEKTEETLPASDRSLLGRAFGNGATPLLFQVLLAGLAAFSTGALVQRVILGEYGITLGPLGLPALPPVTGDSAAQALDLVTEAPEITPILGPGTRAAQDPPLFEQLDESRLRLISIRIDLEIRLKDLARVIGVDRDVPLSRLPARFVKEGVFSAETAKGVEDLLAICDRVVAGAEVEEAASRRLLSESADVLYALRELTRIQADARP